MSGRAAGRGQLAALLTTHLGVVGLPWVDQSCINSVPGSVSCLAAAGCSGFSSPRLPPRRCPLLSRPSPPRRAKNPSGEDINALEQHIKNLLTPSTPDFFNTLYDPYRPGADFVRGYPFSMRDGKHTAVSHGLWLNIPDYDAPTQMVKPAERNERYVDAVMTIPKVGGCAGGRARRAGGGGARGGRGRGRLRRAGREACLVRVHRGRGEPVLQRKDRPPLCSSRPTARGSCPCKPTVCIISVCCAGHPVPHVRHEPGVRPRCHRPGHVLWPDGRGPAVGPLRRWVGRAGCHQGVLRFAQQYGECIANISSSMDRQSSASEAFPLLPWLSMLQTCGQAGA